MHALKLIRDDEFNVPNWIENFGNYNHLPKPAIPCSIEEFWFHMAYYTPTHTDFRQVYLEGEGQAVFNTKLFIFHDRAYAIVIRSNGQTQAYRLGCVHQWNELGQDQCRSRNIRHEGQCWHVYECPKCKTIKVEDSSD